MRERLGQAGYLIREWLGRAGYALAEVAVVAAFGLLPLAVAMVRLNVTAADEGFRLGVATQRFLGQGQLFLYAFSITGTLVWLSVGDFRAAYTKLRVFLAVLVIFLAIAITGTGIFDPSFALPTRDWTVRASLIAYVGSLLLYFLLLFIRKAPPPPIAETLDRSSGDLMRRARRSLAESHEHT